MKNTIKAQVDFSFRGETYHPSIELDLDQFVAQNSDFTTLHQTIAQANNIDTYSYLFEVMEATPIQFSDATGLAADYLQDNQFDFAGFSQALKDKQLSQALNSIAQKTLNTDDIDKQPELKAALIAAYQLGLSHCGKV